MSSLRLRPRSSQRVQLAGSLARCACGLITPLQRFEASDSQRGRQQPRSALPHAGSGAPSDRRLVPPFIIILCLAI